MLMPQASPPWICCQLGAREHYAIPRALYGTGQFHSLITDAWVLPQSILTQFPFPALQTLQERFHSDLEQATVTAFTSPLIRFELAQRLHKKTTWEQIIQRNHWFQHHALRQMARLSQQFSRSRVRPILFAYSYAALQLIRYAKQQGWYTILGQIDPGIVEEEIVIQEHLAHPTLEPNWHPAPAPYWQAWQQECALADCIVVNSQWSGHALEQVGVPAQKIKIIPLAYDTPETALTFQRRYPPAFSQHRPLRVLFLGQIILRKGIVALLDAAQQLQDQPIEFWFVGSQAVVTAAEKTLPRNIRWLGSVPRSETAQYYQQADVFVLPTLSDGFGLTQLEAQAWKLPLIVSQFCGEVVTHQVNGLILPQVNGEAIAQALQFCLQHPQALSEYAQNSTSHLRFSLHQLQQSLQSLIL
jgi:glycosyltransferase involved in cell wall biosynthesis